MSNISFNPLAWAIRPLYTKALADDPTFAQEVKEKESRAEKPKSLEECAEYILGEAFEWASNHRQDNLGFSGLPDDEVVNLIKHYYDEENITIKKVTGAEARVAKSKEKKEDKPKKEEKKTSNVVQIPKEMLERFGATKMLQEAEKKQKESKAQANSEVVMSLGLDWGDEEKEEPKKESSAPAPAPVPSEADNNILNVFDDTKKEEEDDDDLPM